MKTDKKISIEMTKEEFDKIGYNASWGLVVAKKDNLTDTVPPAPASYDTDDQIVVDL